MSEREHSRLLLQMARKNLRAMGGMMDADVFGPEVFGFHAQQAVEKGAKAWLSGIGREYPRVHDLGEIFFALQEGGAVLPAAFLPLEDLTDFAVQYRYEAFEEFGQEINRAETHDLVRRFLHHVAETLGEP